MATPIKIRKLHPDAVIPQYSHRGDAGFDLHVLEDMEIGPHAVSLVHTGLAIALPDGFELQIRLRSGIALNMPIILPNAPATIDSGYRGELGIIVRNLSDAPVFIKKGERIAQGVLCRVYEAQFDLVARLPESERGCAGYGSSGR